MSDKWCDINILYSLAGRVQFELSKKIVERRVESIVVRVSTTQQISDF